MTPKNSLLRLFRLHPFRSRCLIPTTSCRMSKMTSSPFLPRTLDTTCSCPPRI
jgi:hypothetical protein